MVVGAQSIQLVTFIPSLVGAVAAGLVIGNAILTGYRKTVGRRRDLYARIGRLGPGTQLSFFESVLGEPPAIQRTIARRAYRVVVSGDPDYDPALADPDDNSYETVEDRGYRESIFVDRDYYVQAIA